MKLDPAGIVIVILAAPAAVELVASSALLVSMLVIVSSTFPAGAGALRLPPVVVCRSFPTVTSAMLIDGPVTVAVICCFVPGVEKPIEVNRYRVSKGEERSVVLYWYQHPNRVVASEYRSKFFTVADAIRYNRTDMALVRVVVPVRGADEAAAQKTAVEFVQSIFTTLHHYLPS